jgi:hypothetical protein
MFMYVVVTGQGKMGKVDHSEGRGRVGRGLLLFRGSKVVAPAYVD